MNLKTTLQKVLAEFEKNGWEKMCRYDNEPAGAIMIDLESAKKFISQALTEFLKEAFAAIEVEKLDNAKYSDMMYDNPALIKEREGERMFNAALQAIEEKKKNYME